MYHVSAQGVNKRMINVHYYYLANRDLGLPAFDFAYNTYGP